MQSLGILFTNTKPHTEMTRLYAKASNNFLVLQDGRAKSRIEASRYKVTLVSQFDFIHILNI
jgi:hypothetical protein